MATSDVTISLDDSLPSAYVTAYGGTRRERGAAIAAVVRRRGWERMWINYSETYGFQSATYARYRLPANANHSTCPECGERVRLIRDGDPADRWGGIVCHMDGEPLCPVMGPNGYVPADHPSVTDAPAV